MWRLFDPAETMSQIRKRPSMVREEEDGEMPEEDVFPGVGGQCEDAPVKDDVTQSPPLVLPSILQRRRSDRSKQNPVPLCPLR